jgi:hypothetical protein
MLSRVQEKFNITRDIQRHPETSSIPGRLSPTMANLGLSLSIPLSASVDAAQSSDVGSPLVGDCAAQVSNIHADSR